MYGTRDIVKFERRDKEFRYKDKPKDSKRGKKFKRDKPQHKKWM